MDLHNGLGMLSEHTLSITLVPFIGPTVYLVRSISHCIAID